MKRFYSISLVFFVLLLVNSCTTQSGYGKSDLFKVFAAEDGLHFEVNHKPEYVNIKFIVKDISNGKEYPELVGNGEINEYVYAFVSSGKIYEVYCDFYDENWNWTTRIQSEHFTIKSIGGVGQINITYSGFCYDGNKLLSLENYTVSKPNVHLDWEDAFSCIYYTSYPPAYQSYYDWHQEWNGGENYKPLEGSFELNNSIQEILSQKNNFWFKYVYNICYKGNNYQYQIDSQPVAFVYKQNQKTVTSDDGILSIDFRNDGLRIYENLDGNFYKNIRIRVWDCTNDRNCPSIMGNGTQSVFDYPFVEKNCEYYINVEGWDENWQNHKKSDALVVKATGGSGNYIFTYSSVFYNDHDTEDTQVADIILKDYFNYNPLWEYSDNYHVQGEISNKEKTSKVWSYYPFNDGVLNLKDKLSFFRGKDFRLNIQMVFSCKNIDYEYSFLYYDDRYYTDTHPAPSLVLNKAYQEISDFGEYSVSGDNYSKKAFLITYNKSTKAIGDYRGAYSRNAVSQNDDSDCIICDLPVGDIVESNSRAVSNPNPDYSSYKVGVTKKTFDGHVATLVSAHNHCNIWFYNSNDYSTKQVQAKIDRGEFSYQMLGENFDRYFEMMTYVFGSNVPEVQYSEIISVDNETKIDLFICDMTAANYGTNAGMYAGINMYANNSSSNKCEMLYIGTYSILNYGYGTFNVILHEFQHLLTDVNKRFNKSRCGYDHDYTEMMSCACENIFQTQYPENIRTFQNGMISSRLSGCGFNGGYMSGISNWGCFGNTGYNYGTNCAFIDFIMRYYGGVEVLRKIVASPKSNREAIVEGVNEMGYRETIDSLMMKFALCTVNSSMPVEKAANGITATKYISNELVINGRKIKFELMPLYYDWYTSYAPDIYNSDDRYEKIRFNNWENKGPAIIDNSKGYKYMQPQSFNIKYLGQNLNSVNIDNPGDDIILAVVFRE